MAYKNYDHGARFTPQPPASEEGGKHTTGCATAILLSPAQPTTAGPIGGQVSRIIACSLIFMALLLPAALWATHNRAGEIHIRQVGPLTIEATIITWTKSSSINADRDTLDINWGDGSKIQAVVRTNGSGKGVDLPNDIRYNTYVARHTYAGPASYRISMSDPNRIAGIVNVNPPSSDNVPFHIETIYSFQDQQFGGTNTTPYLKQPPIDNACVGKLFKHNPNAFDVDKDSLSYRLIAPLQSLGIPVPNYSYPNQILPGANNTLFLDERTGDITWDAPRASGDYNLAFIIISWRNGVPIDTTIRDMQIFVDDCKNNPPKVATIEKICVTAGQVVTFTATGTDPDSADFVRLTALGGPFDTSIVSPATFTVTSGFRTPPVTGTFRWQTDCSHISDQYYSVVLKAIDSLTANGTQLSDLKTVLIKVVGPAPEDVKAVADIGRTTVSWAKPYFCENVANKYFYGFSVWRREGSNPFKPDTCAPGLAGKGYSEIAFRTVQMRDGRYVFEDTKVERGRTYCYRILAKFARVSAGGYPFNLVEGLPSGEVCVQLPRDLPIMTNVSVEKTSVTDGEISVIWTKPVAKDLDTLLNPGPYRYQLMRSVASGGFVEVPGASFTAPQFWKANDTSFIDKGLNTEGLQYRYQVSFYVGGKTTPLGFSNTASSVFLKVDVTDQASLLSWQEKVPWSNFRYIIYRNNVLGGFDSIGISTINKYTDRGLTNGLRYCYKVRSVGTYAIEGVRSPLENNSQESCNIPLDTVPPCPPILTVKNICESLTPGNEPGPPYINTLRWNNTNACSGSDDTEAYSIWYAPTEGATFILLDKLTGPANTNYTHTLPTDLAGCYAVTAVDTIGNESRRSNVVCVDNCPDYVLPNAFTPNGDDQNDRFVPFPGWRFIDRIDLQIFNRWGNQVFFTNDPAINWDGTTSDGKNAAEGTYFYVCKVYERRVEGVVPRAGVLSGYIELIRGGR